jgi:hypothetical protein
MVSFKDSEKLQHLAKVAAESLYEAVALAVADFRGELVQGASYGHGRWMRRSKARCCSHLRYQATRLSSPAADGRKRELRTTSEIGIALLSALHQDRFERHSAVQDVEILGLPCL